MPDEIEETGMNIIVCVKEIADPEAPADSFKLDTDRNILVASSTVQRVVNPFDEQAVEAALRIKDRSGQGCNQKAGFHGG